MKLEGLKKDKYSLEETLMALDVFKKQPIKSTRGEIVNSNNQSNASEKFQIKSL